MSEQATSAVTSGAVGGGESRAARAVALLAVAEVVGKVATLALLVYAVRVLAPDDFGVFSYALAFGLLLAVLPAWGLDALLVQQVGKDKERLPGQYAQLLVLRTAITIPVLVIGGTAGALARDGAAARFAIVAMLVSALLESYAHAPRAVAGVLRRQSAVAVVLVAQRLLTGVVAAGALAAGFGVTGLVTAYLVTTGLGTLALFVIVASAGGRPSWISVTGQDLRRTARRSVPLGIDALVGMMLFRIDAVLLGWFHGDEAVAEYTAAYRLIETVLFVTWAVSRVTYPAMAAATDLPKLHRALSSGLAVIAFFFTPYAVLLLTRGPDLLELLFGDYYAQNGATVLRVLAFTPPAFAVGFLVSYAFVARDRSDIAVMTSVIAGIGNLVANLLLLPPLSTIGAALTTTGAYALEALLLVLLARKHLGPVGLPRAFALPIACSLPAAAVSFVPWHVVLAAIASGATYLMCWWVTARRLQPEYLAVVRSLASRSAGR